MASLARRSLLAAACGGSFGGAIMLPDPREAFADVQKGIGSADTLAPDAALLAACAAFDALEADYRATDFACAPGSLEDLVNDAARDRIAAAQEPFVARMVELRATTHAGRVARVRSLVGWWPEIMKDGEGTTGDLLTHATLRDLLGEY